MKSRLLAILATSLLAPILIRAAEPQGITALAGATAAAAANKPDEALGLYERVFTESRNMDDWYNAQRGIAVAYAKKGAFPNALQAVRLCLDGAPTIRQFDEATQLAANILSAMDGNVTRGNAFLEFQATGTGENPMAQIPYPALPDRERHFAGIRSEAGDTPAASRLRAWTFAYSGKPNEAIAQFADAFRRASTPQDLQTTGSDLVVVALRLQRGHASGIESEIEFLLSGPEGPDGKPGTPDDLKDPFAGFPSPPPAGQGGLAGIPAAELEALRKIHAAASLYAGDYRMRPEMRRDALQAMQRSNDALDSWGAPGQKDWYLQQLPGAGGAGVEDSLVIGAQAAAKGRTLHFGGAVNLWKEIDGQIASNGLVASKGIERAKKQFDSLSNALRKIRARKPGFKPLAKPATF